MRNSAGVSMSPRVSVLLPNLNNRPYLEERLRTIAAQTLTDYELVIVDNHSDDGAWELFRDWEKRDSRIRLSQAPREGMYANWNNCVRLARGEYVCIATSDDTMEPGFLSQMVAALDEHPSCGLAHCKLRIIDENGDPSSRLDWGRFFPTAFFGELINSRHIRLAPHDGLLHCGVKTVYTSITQLLIRRSLFDTVGVFRTDYGSIADFEWGMRASLVTDTIHVPECLATWRVHQAQGTDLAFMRSADFRRQLLELVDHALRKARAIRPDLLKGVRSSELKHLYLKEMLACERDEQERNGTVSWHRLTRHLWWMTHHPGLMVEYWGYLKQKAEDPSLPFVAPVEPLTFSRELLKRHHLQGNVRVLV